MMPLPAAPSALAAARVTASETPSRELIMLHGIYGRGRNWQGIARALTQARPEYSCWLVDLPHHGESGPGKHGDSVPGMAADFVAWMAATGITPDAILGHSYGGKVALAAAASLDRTQPLQVWIIDSTPEVKEPSGSAWTMLHVIRSLPDRFATRDDAISAIVQAGYPQGVAQWMGTNLVRDDDGFVWRLDFDAMERLLHDFFTTDLWPVVENPAAKLEIHFVKASESSAISPDAVQRIQAVGNGVQLHQLEGGHWIHADDPKAVTALLVEHLP